MIFYMTGFYRSMKIFYTHNPLENIVIIDSSKEKSFLLGSPSLWRGDLLSLLQYLLE